MKILIVNTRHFYGGGDSTYSFNLAELLSSHGHEVAFFAMQDKRNLPDPNADLFVSPIEFRELNQHKTLANGVKVLSRTIYSTEARRKFATLLDRFSPDIIHLQNFYFHITPSILFEARQRGLPAVWTLHDYGLACPNSHFLIDRTGQICEACRGGRFYQMLIKQCKKGSLLASGMAAFEAYCNRWMGVLKKVDAFLTQAVS
jgi:glycosyltransferase involved in cell wall biosynthesis